MASINKAILSRKKIIIFGAGNAGRLVAQQPLPFSYCVDNDTSKQQSCLLGLAIKPPIALLEEPKGECFVVIANYVHNQAIARQLMDMGFIPGEDFADFRECDLDGSMPVIEQLRINVTRKCNSRCLMCNVWQDKNAVEFSPAQMGQMLKDPFFRNVKDAYITGGEPTALNDFSAYVQAAVSSLPSLKHISTSVNGLLPEKTIVMIQKCKHICENEGVGLFVSVSLDGLEQDNDRQRGVPGSFNKAMETINGLRGAGIPVTISTTITNINLHGMDGFLDFLIGENLQCFFKLGIQANFFNNRSSEDLFYYTDDEIFLLKRFLLRVADVYKDNSYARTVALNQFYMLEGSGRLLSCAFLENTAATLSETGQLKYCNSKSKDLGSVLNAPAAWIYENNREYLSFLEHTNCLHCNADTFSDQSPGLKALLEAEDYWKGFFGQQEWLTSMADQSLVGDVYHYATDSVLLVGFFGNETEGDADLLRKLVGHCEKEYPGRHMIIASSLPFVTRYMLKKAASDKQIEVLPTHDMRFLSACHYAPHILAVTLREPYYPWVKCAEHIASKTGKTVTYFSPAKRAGEKEAPAYES